MIQEKITPFYLWLFIVVFSYSWINTLKAEQLTVVITKGVEGALPIAIVPFKWRASSTSPIKIDQILRADLQRSGEFSILSGYQLPQKPQNKKAIKFDLWQNKEIDYLVIGELKPLPRQQYEVAFQLFDVYSKERLIGLRFNSSKKKLRRVAHRISNLIYETLLSGKKGAFDTRIAYVKALNKKGKRQYILAVADADGYNEQVVLSSTQPIMSPSWSPDGRFLVYVSFEKRRSMIFQQELRTGKRRKLAEYQGINSAPRWSPDGKRLALVLSKDGNSEIYIMHLANRKLQRITYNSAIDTEPAWSPDGKQLAFTSDRSGRPQIYQVKVNQQGRVDRPRRITFNKGNYNARPSYSPDGKYLAMVHRTKGKYRIATLELKSGYFLVLTQSKMDESPSFAPNSKMLIYATEKAGKGVLEAVAVEGLAPPQRLKLQQGDVREPAWSPYR